MKKIITAIILLTVSLSLCLPVSAQTLELQDRFLEYLEERTQDEDEKFYSQYELLMYDFMLSDNPEEILYHLIAEREDVPEYTLETKSRSSLTPYYLSTGLYYQYTEYTTLTGMILSVRDTNDHTIKSLTSENIEVQCVLEYYYDDNDVKHHTSTNSVAVKKEAFNLLSEEMQEYLSKLDNVQKYFDCYPYFSADENGYFGPGDMWYTPDIESGSEYRADYDEHFFESSVLMNPDLTIARFSTLYTNVTPIVYSVSSEKFDMVCAQFYMTLFYSAPENEADKDDYSKYELESVAFLTPIVRTFEGGVDETSPQTGDGIMTAALAGSAAAIAALAVYLRRKMR